MKLSSFLVISGWESRRQNPLRWLAQCLLPRECSVDASCNYFAVVVIATGFLVYLFQKLCIHALNSYNNLTKYEEMEREQKITLVGKW